MYLRFVVGEFDEDSGQELGLFQALYSLRESGKLREYEEQQHDEILKWFDTNLPRPTKFTSSKPPFYRKQNKAISWFKDTANEHLSRARVLVGILQNHGIDVQMLKAERVGYVVYEDEYQIVAEPFAETP